MKSTTKDYPEDFQLENGLYQNICRECGEFFMGHKRRVWCKECINKGRKFNSMEKHIIQFLELNGFKKHDRNDNAHSWANDIIAIEITEDELVFIDDTGDFCHTPIDFFALIGVLIHYRIIPINYNHINQ